jgi:hydroxymethylpyrimidine pyrophosphatase-like HAD family hydrolase
MPLPFKILSTDFDGTLHAEGEDPPIPRELQDLIRELQSQGVIWVINTGRDRFSLMETLGRAAPSTWPDYVVTVEREIYRRDKAQYVEVDDWNRGCSLAHEKVFVRLKMDVPRLTEWVTARFQATIYEDAYSPFCFIAQNPSDAETIHDFLNDYCAEIPDLAVVRNDVYARFCHLSYNKGSALTEIGRRIGVSPHHIVAAGDHLNDLPMLSRNHARWLIAPSNAVPSVKETVRRQEGYVSDHPHGYGVLSGLKFILSLPAPL